VRRVPRLVRSLGGALPEEILAEATGPEPAAESKGSAAAVTEGPRGVERVPAAVAPSQVEEIVVTLAAPGGGGEVEAGGRLSLNGLVRNQSGIVDHYDVRLDGVAPAWATVTPPSVDLVPFGAGRGVHEEVVGAEVHPPRTCQAKAGGWSVRLVATARTGGTARAPAPVEVVVRPFAQVSAFLSPKRVRGRRTASYGLTITNWGNAPAPCRPSGADPEGRVRFAFAEPEVVLSPCEERVIALHASARRPIVGTDREHPLTIRADGLHADSASALTATFVQRPSITHRTALAARIGATMTAAGLFVAAAFAVWEGGVRALCTSAADNCLGYDRFLRDGLNADITRPDLSSGLNGLFAFATSTGIVCLLLALIALAGLRSGGPTLEGGHRGTGPGDRDHDRAGRRECGGAPGWRSRRRSSRWQVACSATRGSARDGGVPGLRVGEPCRRPVLPLLRRGLGAHGRGDGTTPRALALCPG
jgi:hypothetical protein